MKLLRVNIIRNSNFEKNWNNKIKIYKIEEKANFENKIRVEKISKAKKFLYEYPYFELFVKHLIKRGKYYYALRIFNSVLEKLVKLNYTRKNIVGTKVKRMNTPINIKNYLIKLRFTCYIKSIFKGHTAIIAKHIIGEFKSVKLMIKWLFRGIKLNLRRSLNKNKNFKYNYAELVFSEIKDLVDRNKGLLISKRIELEKILRKLI